MSFFKEINLFAASDASSSPITPTPSPPLPPTPAPTPNAWVCDKKNVGKCRAAIGGVPKDVCEGICSATPPPTPPLPPSPDNCVNTEFPNREDQPYYHTVKAGEFCESIIACKCNLGFTGSFQDYICSSEPPGRCTTNDGKDLEVGDIIVYNCAGCK